jgi:hypothetical protein
MRQTLVTSGAPFLAPEAKQDRNRHGADWCRLPLRTIVLFHSKQPNDIPRTPVIRNRAGAHRGCLASDSYDTPGSGRNVAVEPCSFGNGPYGESRSKAFIPFPPNHNG